MKKLQLNLTKDISTDIIIGNGVVKKLNSILDILSKNSIFFIFTNQNILNYYNELIKEQFYNRQYHVILCPDGESAKDFDYIQTIYSDLIKLGCNRKSYLVAFGGGVIGDVTGFVAATFMRGIQYINIPTTLLGMVDSSIGGKTGINLSSGKNLVGSIYHPKKVIIDSDFLATLPDREYRSGMAEVIKYGLILDKVLFEKLEDVLEQLLTNNRSFIFLNEIILICIQLKINIVEQDELDNNIRNILNFGHTIGHAFEAYFSYKNMLHGEAVAYGMLYASKLSNLYGKLSKEELNRINDIILKLNLPKINKIKANQILKFIKNDKKKTSHGLNFILLNQIGEANISQNISYNNIEMVIK